VVTDDIPVGGENRFKYKIPANVKYANLELKRGLVPEDSKLIAWVTNTLQKGLSNKIETRQLRSLY
jgi:hypothetical protein